MKYLVWNHQITSWETDWISTKLPTSLFELPHLNEPPTLLHLSPTCALYALYWTLKSHTDRQREYQGQGNTKPLLCYQKNMTSRLVELSYILFSFFHCVIICGVNSSYNKMAKKLHSQAYMGMKSSTLIVYSGFKLYFTILWVWNTPCSVEKAKCVCKVR